MVSRDEHSAVARLAAQKLAYKKPAQPASKYDFVKVKVWLGGSGSSRDHYYVLSRFLVARTLTMTKVPQAKAVRIALDLKKYLVDNERLDIEQAQLEPVLFAVMRAYGCGEAYEKRYATLTRFHHSRRPLIVLVCGTACSGKSTVAQKLAARLNLPNVLQTDVIYELLRTSESSPLPQTPLWRRPELAPPQHPSSSKDGASSKGESSKDGASKTSSSSGIGSGGSSSSSSSSSATPLAASGGFCGAEGDGSGPAGNNVSSSNVAGGGGSSSSSSNSSGGGGGGADGVGKNYERLLGEYRREALLVRRGLDGHLQKALSDGKSAIIEGFHLDPGLYLPQRSAPRAPSPHPPSSLPPLLLSPQPPADGAAGGESSSSLTEQQRQEGQEGQEGMRRGRSAAEASAAAAVRAERGGSGGSGQSQPSPVLEPVPASSGASGHVCSSACGGAACWYTALSGGPAPASTPAPAPAPAPAKANTEGATRPPLPPDAHVAAAAVAATRRYGEGGGAGDGQGSAGRRDAVAGSNDSGGGGGGGGGGGARGPSLGPIFVPLLIEMDPRDQQVLLPSWLERHQAADDALRAPRSSPPCAKTGAHSGSSSNGASGPGGSGGGSAGGGGGGSNSSGNANADKSPGKAAMVEPAAPTSSGGGGGVGGGGGGGGGGGSASVAVWTMPAAKPCLEDVQRATSQLQAVAGYLRRFQEVGVPCFRLSLRGFDDAVAAMHAYLLQCIEAAMAQQEDGSGSPRQGPRQGPAATDGGAAADGGESGSGDGSSSGVKSGSGGGGAGGGDCQRLAEGDRALSS